MTNEKSDAILQTLNELYIRDLSFFQGQYLKCEKCPFETFEGTCEALKSLNFCEKYKKESRAEK